MNRNKKYAHYIEELSRSILSAKPYYVDPGARINGESSKVTEFPDRPGIYIILRKVQIVDNDYTTKGVNTKIPLVLYVGKTTSRRSIKRRLFDHFGGIKPNYQGSQFKKFLYQVCQEHEMVKRILCSPNTLIAAVAIEEDDTIIDFIEKLAIKVFQPRFNIKDR